VVFCNSAFHADTQLWSSGTTHSLSYFFEADGNMVAAIIVDIQSADQILVLAESTPGQVLSSVHC
jgi:hypothetical protein